MATARNIQVRTMILGAVVVFLSSVTVAEIHAQQREGGKRYAILIGVSQYFKDQFRNLKNAEQDVNALAAVLQKSGYDKDGILVMSREKAADDINLLPTAANIQAMLKLWMEKCTANDRLLIAFAGHAVHFDGERDSYLCPADARLDRDNGTLISIQKLFEQLRNCPAKQKLLLVDASREGAIIARSPRRVARGWNPRYRMKVRPTAGLAAIFSCSEDEFGYERNDMKRSVFFHAIAEGLKGKADTDKDKVIELVELAIYVKKTVSDYTWPAHRQSQTPMLLSEIRGGFPIAEMFEPGKTLIAGRLQAADGFDTRRKQSYFKLHGVKLSKDQTYTIDMTSGDFDTYLRIEDESGKEIAYDDDGGAGLNSQIKLKPDETGKYRIVATSYASGATGAYQIEITPKAETFVIKSEVVLAVDRILTSRDPFDSVRRKSRAQEHVVTLEKGKYYTIEAHSTELDTYLRLRDHNGKTLKYDDDSGVGLNAMLTYEPAATGKYRVIVTTYRSDQEGAYKLYVREGRTRFDTANKRIQKESAARADVSLGRNFLDDKRYSNAIAAADGVLRDFPEYAPALLVKAKAYELQNKLSSAIRLCDQAIRLEPNNCTAYNVRGNTYFAQGSYQNAIADYTSALRLSPSEEVYFANRGSAYERIGKDASAMADAKRALSLRPNYDYAEKLKGILDKKRLYGDKTGVVEFKNLSNRSIKYQMRWKTYRDTWTDWQTWTIEGNGRFWNWMKGAVSCEVKIDTDGGNRTKWKTFTLKFYRYPSTRKVEQAMGRPYRFHWVGNEIWISEPD